MRIINYNVDKEKALQFLSIEPFILDVVNKLNVQLMDPDEMLVDKEMVNAPIRFFKTPRYENVATLLHTLPIYLTTSGGKVDEHAYKEGYDIFGGYWYYKNKYNPNLSPFIEICIDNIDNLIKEKDVELYGQRVYKWAYTYALLHGLAHAAMDFRNCVDYYNCDGKLSDWNAKKVIEEAMANAIALRVIKAYEGCKDYKEFHTFAKWFCEYKQDAEYSIGAYLVDFEREKLNDFVKAKAKGLTDDEKKVWENWIIDNSRDKENKIREQLGLQV